MGGAEIWMLELSKFLKENPGYSSKLEIELLLTSGNKDVLDEQFSNLGIKLHYIKFSISTFFSFRKKFISLLKRQKFNVLHSHQDFVSGWLFLAGAGYLTSIRVSYIHNPFQTLNNYLSKPHRYVSYHLGRILMLLFSTRLSGTSKQVMADYGYYKFPYKYKNAGSVHCGFNPEKFFLDKKECRQNLCNEFGWNKENTKIALFVGRLDLDDKHGKSLNQKNPEFAFKIAKELVTNYTNWRFIFVGKKGDYASEMETEINKLKLNDKIKLFGIRLDIPEIMNASTVLIFPSYWEALGMVAVEAQASRLKVIASDNIPDEAAVSSTLYQSISLKQPITDWVDAIINPMNSAMNIDINMCRKEFENSGFSIKNSIFDLLKLYS